MKLASAAQAARAGQRFSAEDMRRLCLDALRPGLDEVALAQLLTALAERGETAEEIRGAALALREVALPFAELPARAIDTCGTGGDGKQAFNLSTAAALVAAAAGAVVVKHGNRSVSSSCGSADLLEAAGVKLSLSATGAQEVLEACGMVFLYAPAFHPAMRHVAPVRRRLGRRTLFNFVGPLAHPGAIRRQLLGVADARRLDDYAAILPELGVSHAYVVHGADGADELTLAGDNELRVVGQAPAIPPGPRAWGFTPAADECLRGGAPAHNLKMLAELFAGAAGPVREAVLLNTAAALMLAEVATSVDEAVARAAEAIDRGDARRCLERMVTVSRQAEEAVA